MVPIGVPFRGRSNCKRKVKPKTTLRLETERGTQERHEKN